MAQVSVEGLRLYGVAALESSTATSLAGGTTIVPFRMLGAIVAPVPYGRVTLDEAEMKEYTRVIEEAHATSCVLPAPPGTVFRTEESLARWLELHYFTLTQAMGVVEGHATARVLITRSRGAATTRAGAEQLREELRQLAAVASDSMRVLRGQAAATISLPVAEDDPNVVSHASFLVDTERWSLFTELVATEDQRHADLDFRVTGPWPPYDFVRMEFGG